jgi:hypothetical protein
MGHGVISQCKPNTDIAAGKSDSAPRVRVSSEKCNRFRSFGYTPLGVGKSLKEIAHCQSRSSISIGLCAGVSAIRTLLDPRPDESFPLQPVGEQSQPANPIPARIVLAFGSGRGAHRDPSISLSYGETISGTVGSPRLRPLRNPGMDASFFRYGWSAAATRGARTFNQRY